MFQLRRLAGVLPVVVLALAACAAPGTGAGDADTSTSAEPMTTGSPASSVAASASAGAEATGATESGQRVDISSLAADPGSYEGQEIRVLARVDSVLVDNVAFMTSPSGGEEGQFPVVVAADGTVDKEPVEGSVVWIDGTMVGFTPENLEAAGVDLPDDALVGFDGEYVFVASSVTDPLAQGDGS